MYDSKRRSVVPAAGPPAVQITALLVNVPVDAVTAGVGNTQRLTDRHR